MVQGFGIEVVSVLGFWGFIWRAYTELGWITLKLGPIVAPNKV